MLLELNDTFILMLRNGEQFVRNKLIYTGDFLDNDFRDLYPNYSWVSESILKLGRKVDETQSNGLRITNVSANRISYLLIETYSDKYVLFDVEPQSIINLKFRFLGQLSCQGEFDSTMLWGYFFLDPDQEKLRRLGKHLESQGYRIVEIHKPEDGDEFVLHVERDERHTAETLARRNGEFKSLAAQFNIQLYDGWDAGNIK